MILNAVIIKSKQTKINYILRTGNYYSNIAEEDNKSREIRFYKNEEVAKNNYPKIISGIINVTIDTENIEFFGRNNIPVLSKPHFFETDTEYVFSFDESIKDLHCKIKVS